MSLLNQVLRNLDQRQAQAAPAVAIPQALKTQKRPAAATPARRAKRWALGAAVTATAVVVGGWAQGSLTWPLKGVGSDAPLGAAVAAPVQVAVQAPVQAPVQQPVAAAPVAAPVVEPVAPPVQPVAAVATPLIPPAPTPEPAVQIALAAPTSRPAPVLAKREPTPKPKVTASAAPTTAKGDARIDKRVAGRTSQERADAHYQRGVAAHQAGQFNDSADAFAAALREEPRFAPARLAQAGVLITVARHNDAYVLLQEGLALTPQQPALSLMLARLQAERLELDQASATLQAALPAAAGNAEYLGTYAAILQRANRHAEASQQYGAALRIAPANSVWWMGLGMSLVMIDQPAAAREAFTRAKAIGLPPEAAQYVDARLRQL